jgi:hypothetical protein
VYGLFDIAAESPGSIDQNVRHVRTLTDMDRNKDAVADFTVSRENGQVYLLAWKQDHAQNSRAMSRISEPESHYVAGISMPLQLSARVGATRDTESLSRCYAGSPLLLRRQ